MTPIFALVFMSPDLRGVYIRSRSPLSHCPKDREKRAGGRSLANSRVGRDKEPPLPRRLTGQELCRVGEWVMAAAGWMAVEIQGGIPAMAGQG